MSQENRKGLSPHHEKMVREYVRGRIQELVRKKEGGGGYTLYSPNQGKKNPPKAVGDFPTKVMAKRAELLRYPPKDASRLKKARKQIDKLQKDPQKRAEKEREWNRPKRKGRAGAPHREPATKKKTESADPLLRSMIRVVKEALFKEEEGPVSQWDERMTRLSKAAVEADSKLQRLQKDIEKRTVSSLQKSVDIVSKSLKKMKAKVSGGDVKRDPQRMKSYVEISLQLDGVEVGPIYVFVENGKLRCEISSSAKASFSKLKPERAKELRAELISIQEDVLDGQNDISTAIQARDKYLDGLQGKMDSYVAGMSALELSVLKGLLVNKYRGR